MSSNLQNATMKSSLATAKSKAGALTGDDAGAGSDDAQSPRGGGGGAGGFPGMGGGGGGGGGGMPDLSSLMVRSVLSWLCCRSSYCTSEQPSNHANVC